jgi:hypothetical protein
MSLKAFLRSFFPHSVTSVCTCTSHILRRNCLLEHVIEGKIEGRIQVTGRGGRRRMQLLDDLKENKGYLKLKEEALNRAAWRTRLEEAVELSLRQATE